MTNNLTPASTDLDHELDEAAKMGRRIRMVAFPLILAAVLVLAIYAIATANSAAKAARIATQVRATASVAVSQAQDGKDLASKVAEACAVSVQARGLGELCAKASTVAAAPSVVVPTPPAGAQGRDGRNGNNGLDGLPGPRGPAGPTGSPGPRGPAGPRGTAGRPGLAGQNGANGADGLPGQAGPAGPAGPDGKDGANGTDGKDGANGTDGKDGANGTDGAPPESWTWTDPNGVHYSCTRDPDSPRSAPTYTCAAIPAPANHR